MRTELKSLLERSDRPAGRAFDLLIQGLIVLSLVTYSVETLPDLSPSWRAAMETIEAITVAAFTAEYLLRLYVADKPLRFARSFFGVVDLLAILPYYVAVGLDLRAVRAFRLLRLFRLLKLARYARAMRRFHNALLLAREEIVLFLAAAGVLLFLSAAGIHHFEHEAQPEAFGSIFQSLWWAVVTLTTVGYGDVYPITVGGRIFTFAVLLTGLGFVSVPAGLIASALGRARAAEEAEAAQEEERLRALEASDPRE